ncbi:hypothetical protein ACNHYB_01900 [Isoptericola jiangsuensis]|uniref:hypothetical protein n=1 Tax=Isoptericola jiangsuensis TaxID=548579 RepID=UPI003AAAA04E
MTWRRFRTTAVAGAIGLASLGAAPTADAAPTVVGPTTVVAGSPADDDVEARWSEALQELVDDGAITRARRDAVLAGLTGRQAGPVDPPAPRLDDRLVSPGAAARALGLSVEAFETATAAPGATLVSVAEARGIDPGSLVDALVTAALGGVDDAVGAGLLTTQEAAERRAELPGVIADLVEAQSIRGPAV